MPEGSFYVGAHNWGLFLLAAKRPLRSTTFRLASFLTYPRRLANSTKNFPTNPEAFWSYVAITNHQSVLHLAELPNQLPTESVSSRSN